MATRVLISVSLFLAVCVLFVGTSGAATDVKLSVIGSWLLVATVLGTIIWWPGIRPASRVLILATALIAGAWFLTFVATRVVGNFEMSVWSVGVYLTTETVLVLSLFGLTRIVEMIVNRISVGRG